MEAVGSQWGQKDKVHSGVGPGGQQAGRLPGRETGGVRCLPWARSPSPPAMSCSTAGNLFSDLPPRSPHLENGENQSHSSGGCCCEDSGGPWRETRFVDCILPFTITVL